MEISLALLFCILMPFLQGQVALATNAPLVPALFIFGDSIMDTGTNNAIVTITKCDFPPYGKDFPGSMPTGRFCNGKVPTDLLASVLKVKEFVPPFLGSDLSLEDLLTGVCFASGGSGFDDLTPKILTVLTMTDQLKHFKEYKEKLKAVAGEERAAYVISEGLYIIACGSDDFLNNYFALPMRKEHYDVSSYADQLVSLASDFIKELSQSGARKIGLIGIPPIGCLPLQRTLAGGVTRDCDASRNEAAQLFNSKMQDQIAKLSSDATVVNGTRIVFLDIYNSLLDIIEKPSIYGFEEAAKGCCGTGELEVSVLCNEHSPLCEDDTKYVFWDSYHPTERTYRIIVDELYKRYINFLM